MSLHVVKKVLAPGKGSEISHLVSRVAADVPFSKTCTSFIIHTGLKIPERLVLKCLKKGLKLIFKNR